MLRYSVCVILSVLRVEGLTGCDDTGVGIALIGGKVCAEAPNSV